MDKAILTKTGWFKLLDKEMRKMAYALLTKEDVEYFNAGSRSGAIILVSPRGYQILLTVAQNAAP